MLTLTDARSWYPHDDAVHGFDHIERVYAIAQRLAAEEGADWEIVSAAALLHDVEGSHPGSGKRASHHEYSAEFAAQVLQQEGWDPARIAAVQHCIRAHRFRGDGSEPPQTLEAKVLFDADKLDVLGAIGAARTVGYAALNRQPVFAVPSQKFLETGEKEPGEPHSSYHEYLFKLRKISDRLFTPSARAIAAQRQAYLAGFYEQLAAEVRGER